MLLRGLGRRGDSSPQPPGAMRRVLTELRPYWRGVIGVFALQMLAVPLLLLIPVPLKIAVDSVIGSQPLPGPLDAVLPDTVNDSVSALLLVAAGLQILVALLSRLQSLGAESLRAMVGERMTLAFRARLVRHAQRLSFSYHDRKGATDAVYRVQYDGQSLQWVTLDSLLPAAVAAMSFAAIVVVIMRLNLQLSLVALTASPILIALARAYGRRVRPRYQAVHELESDAMSTVQETLSSLRVVKAFGREDAEERRFLDVCGIGVRARIRLTVAEGVFGTLVGLVTAAGVAAVLVIGVNDVLAGALTLGELLMVVTYLTQLYGPLEDVTWQSTEAQSSLARAERAFQLLDEEPEVVQRPDAVPLVRTTGAVELRGVSYAYAPGSPVLRDLDLRVDPGTAVGIAGQTGAGKTTLMGLLTRFQDPTSGAVLLDGVDLRDYRLADLREQFAIVLQDAVLFSTSIAENIAYGRPGASDAEIVTAARSANAHEFIRHLPDGYDTVVGERGMRMSGGERQRISLARAFLKDAPILLLDEPTSAVDVDTEDLILDAITRLMAGRTTFLVTHRPTTLDVCDVQVHLVDGRLHVQAGPHRIVDIGELYGVPSTMGVARHARSGW